MTFSRLAHHRVGTGTPILLLHGIGHRHQAWSPVIERLRHHHDVIAVDLTGFGGSPAHPKGTRHTAEAIADHIVENYRVWGIERPHVAGNSLGGAVALELARRGQVASATALAPASFIRARDAHAALPLVAMRLGALLTPAPLLRALTRLGWVRTIIGWPLYAHPQRHTAQSTYDDAMAMKRARGFEATAIRCLAPVFRSFRGPMRAPVTIAWGTRDRILPFGQMSRARRLVPEAEFVALEGAGHVPMSDCPDEITELIRVTVLRAEGVERGVA